VNLASGCFRATEGSAQKRESAVFWGSGAWGVKKFHNYFGVEGAQKSQGKTRAKFPRTALRTARTTTQNQIEQTPTYNKFLKTNTLHIESRGFSFHTSTEGSNDENRFGAFVFQGRNC
jgi:hypothetical protein